MKTRILARCYQDAEWIALAYHGEVAFCSVRASSENKLLEALTNTAQQIISPQARAWLEDSKRPGPNVINCPEGAVKLPADLWVCTLTRAPCPIQAQVHLNDQDFFIAHCQAPPERKEQIFSVVANGTYDGFHHIPGRYLCPGCERDKRRMNFRHHYPWELTHLEAYYPFELERDWPSVRPKLKDKLFGLTAVSNALCATHCKELAQQLDPVLAAQLTAVEFELFR